MGAYSHIKAIGHFPIQDVLSEGGMAVILLTQVEGEPRALKMARPARTYEKQQLFNEAIKKEAEFLARVSHPRIVKVFPIPMPRRGGTRRTFTARAMEFKHRPWFMLLEYLSGGTVDAFVKQHGPLSVFDATNIVGNVGLGINYLHYYGVAHKDLSPKNIMFRRPPQKGAAGGFDPVIIDFGAVAGAIRATEVEIGALYIMSPERIRHARGQTPPELEGHLDKRKTDIWALGVLLYFLLTGRYPFNARTSRKLTSQILTTTPPPLSQFNAQVDPALESFVLEGMLAKDPAIRPNIQEVLRFLKPYGSAQSN